MKSRKRIILSAVVLAAALVAGIWARDYITLDNVKKNRDLLQEFVNGHYFVSVAAFIGLFICTGFFLPGALALTVAAGYLFGTVHGVIFVNIGGTAGAALAFLTSRYVAGGWLQEKYKTQLHAFNREIEKHGVKYLIAARFIPLFPFFFVNYFAGLTQMRLTTYVIMTFIGMLPGSVIFAYAGRRLATISRVEDILSPPFLFILGLVVFFILLPVIIDVFKRSRSKRGGNKQP